jgi:hypothetical protein
LIDYILFTAIQSWSLIFLQEILGVVQTLKLSRRIVWPKLLSIEQRIILIKCDDDEIEYNKNSKNKQKKLLLD